MTRRTRTALICMAAAITAVALTATIVEDTIFGTGAVGAAEYQQGYQWLTTTRRELTAKEHTKRDSPATPTTPTDGTRTGRTPPASAFIRSGWTASIDCRLASRQEKNTQGVTRKHLDDWVRGCEDAMRDLPRQ
ncbi:hypothetical protein [Streptomyces noursei]|uniref:hypothetical protein n=1 Tax=Streptomyces noursei TaxID=1971 RepID=UPI001673095C|nr:hypothetical protein [Streptomyces noursei]MCZ1021032.1 hypothetical protein [Streptomyces noursei]GGX52098.1 hypothetical protein GCM10010341_86910 [Streptomyces noursei]